MPHLYVFTAGGKQARNNLRRSIQNPVPIDVFRPHVSAEQLDLLERIEAAQGGIYEWGAKPGDFNTPNWEQLAVGDAVLIGFGGSYRYVADVVGKFHNRAAAAALWGQQEDGLFYEYMYFLSRPRPIQVRYDAVDGLLNERYFGFTRISDAKVAEIERRFGSVHSFIQQVLVDHLPSGAIVVDKADSAADFGGVLPGSPKSPPTESINGEKELLEASLEAVEQGDFDADDPRDTRKQTVRAIVQRRGQPQFRKALLDAYDRRCAITGNSCIAALEAAHIRAYRGDHTNDVRNGLLLRADIHTLFDLGLLTINADDYTVVLELNTRHSEYGYLHGRSLSLPKLPIQHPSRDALRSHRAACGF